MIILLSLAVMLVISMITLHVVASLFGNSKLTFKETAVAAVVVTIVGTIASFVPYVGLILAVVINIVIVMNLLEISALSAFLALILWGALNRLALWALMEMFV
jgi:hypothetical protein